MRLTRRSASTGTGTRWRPSMDTLVFSTSMTSGFAVLILDQITMTREQSSRTWAEASHNNFSMETQPGGGFHELYIFQRRWKAIIQ